MPTGVQATSSSLAVNTSVLVAPGETKTLTLDLTDGRRIASGGAPCGLGGNAINSTSVASPGYYPGGPGYSYCSGINDVLEQSDDDAFWTRDSYADIGGQKLAPDRAEDCHRLHRALAEVEPILIVIKVLLVSRMNCSLI